MIHRIVAGTLLVRDNSILLVKHVDPDTGRTWWVPPGGGLEESDNSIYECAQREAFEETGLTVELGRIIYIGERFEVETDTLMVAFFIRGSGYSGELTIRNIHGKGPDDAFIKDARWIHREELPNIAVYPEMLRDAFWEDLAQGFPQTRYLGRASD